MELQTCSYMKRIIFICGSLETGKDGVGDYTRRLACELARQDMEVKIVALNDRYIESECFGLQQDGNTFVSVVRLPYSTSWDVRFQCLKEIITSFKPDWISLQFVIFTFHKKGLPFNLAHKIKMLNNNGARWHIMFHELWVGMNVEASLKLKFLGILQKTIIRSFIKKLKPSVVHTHALIYEQQLKKWYCPVYSLPLFTNLFIDEVLYKSLKRQNISERTSEIVFSLFGGIHPGGPIEQFADELLMYAEHKHVKAKIKVVGRAGKEQEAWFTIFTSKGIDINLLGELSIEQVNKELFTSHYGISTTPRLLADKSSSVATMLGHRLPVICVAKSWTPNCRFVKPSKDDNVFEYKTGNLKPILEQGKPMNALVSLLGVARQFLNDIQ